MEHESSINNPGQIFHVLSPLINGEETNKELHSGDYVNKDSYTQIKKIWNDETDQPYKVTVFNVIV